MDVRLIEELEAERGYVASQLERLPAMPGDTVRLMWQHRFDALNNQLATERVRK